MDSTANILQFCRLCLVKDGVNIPIFDEQGDIRQIYLKISSCLPVKVAREDHLPKKICDGCSNKLDNFYDFWRTSAESEKQLLAWLGATGKDAAQVNVKEEDNFDEPLASDISKNDDDENKCYMFEQKVEEGPPVEINDEPPPSKRPRRTAAVKAAIAMDQNSDDDGDSGEPITKMEDDSDETDGDDREPAFVDVPSTSADDQPGPSGVSKDGSDAPKSKRYRKTKPKTKQKMTVEPVLLAEALNCKFCSETFNTNVDFALHSIEHSAERVYSCHLCQFSLKSKYRFEKHVRAHEGSNLYKCEICSKPFKIGTHAVEHVYFHRGEKPFQCEICGKHFMYSRLLSSHRRLTHYELLTGKPLVKFDCKVCGKHYESYPGLTRHMYSKHNDKGIDKSVMCDVCGKKIKNKDKLKFHLRTHTGDRPFPCTLCERKFSKKDLLRAHMPVHTGAKPFACKVCGKAFAHRAPLWYHRKTHTGEKPNVCPLCGKGFISKPAMDNHVKTCYKV